MRYCKNCWHGEYNREKKKLKIQTLLLVFHAFQRRNRDYYDIIYYSALFMFLRLGAHAGSRVLAQARLDLDTVIFEREKINDDVSTVT